MECRYLHACYTECAEGLHPIVYSSNIQDEVDARSLNFAQSILFEFNINNMNPFKIAVTIANR